MSDQRRLLPFFLVPALPLLIPLFGSFFSGEIQWTVFDYVVAYVLLTGASLAYRLSTNPAATRAYRAATALGIFGGLSLVWVNLAVGFIGSEDNPANLLYGIVLMIGALGAVLARLQPVAMARTLFAMAGAQFLVPIVAFLIWRPNFDANVAKIFFLNFVWVLMFTISGLLFRQSAEPTTSAPPASV